MKLHLDKEIESTMCKRCGRRLRTEESIKLGFGPSCWKKTLQDKRKLKKLF